MLLFGVERVPGSTLSLRALTPRFRNLGFVVALKFDDTVAPCRAGGFTAPTVAYTPWATGQGRGTCATFGKYNK